MTAWYKAPLDWGVLRMTFQPVLRNLMFSAVLSYCEYGHCSKDILMALNKLASLWAGSLDFQTNFLLGFLTYFLTGLLTCFLTGFLTCFLACFLTAF